MYEVKLNKYSGPLDKLLQLIEERKLEITELSLAEVTGDFIDYLGELKERDSEVLADFLVVAARLLLIKSKQLLPDLALTSDEEAEIKDLESRLAVYKEFAVRSGAERKSGSASQNLQALWNRKTISLARPLFLGLDRQAVFYPPPKLAADHILSAVKRATEELETFMPKSTPIREVVMSIEEKVAELLERCKEAIRHTFKGIALNKPRKEIVVLFLAVLHLLREKVIHVEQEGQFGDIIIKKNSV